MRIQHNIPAMNSYRNFSANNSNLSKNLEKLSSGYKINRAGDDAAGLAISEKMRAQISGLTGAKKNATDGISLIQTAEGALTEVHDMLNRMYTLAEQSANGTYDNDVDRVQLQKEVSALKDEINRIADSTNFNGLKLLDGSLETTKADALTLSEAEAANFGDGVEVEEAPGEGAKSTFSLSIDTLFTNGDTLTLNFRQPTGNGDGYTKTSLKLTKGATEAVAGNSGVANSMEDGVFTGDSVEEQAASIKRVLQGAVANSDAKGFFNEYTGDFDISLSGSSLTFTAKEDGSVGKLHLASVDVADSGGEVETVVTQAGANATADVAAGNQGIVKLTTSTDYFQKGDQLQFSFKVGPKETLATATIEITQEMIDTSDAGDIVSAIAEKLGDTQLEAVNTIDTDGDSEPDAPDPTFDVTQFKAGDIFTFTAGNVVGAGDLTDKTSIKVGLKSTDALASTASNTFQNAQVKRQGQTNFVNLEDSAAQIMPGTNTATNTGAKAEIQTAKFTGLNKGDTVTVEGKLEDGRAFSVTLTAAEAADAENNMFALKTDGADDAANNAGTAMNIRAALMHADTTITVDNGDGTTSKLKGSDLFKLANAGDASKATFTMDNTDDGSDNSFTITNRMVGVAGTKGLTGQIDSITVSTTPADASFKEIQKGEEEKAAETSISFDADAIEYGTAVTIGDKTFELVDSKDAVTTESGNVRVVMSNLEGASSDDIANAFKSAIEDEMDADADYAEALDNASLTVSDGTLTMTKENAGKSDAIAASAAYGKNGGTVVDFASKEDGSLKLKAGDTLKVNGKTYQFDTSVRNLEGDNELIKVSDFTDKKAISQAIKTAVEEVDDTVSVTVNDDGTATLRGKLVDGETATPFVDLAKASGGLSLQIGDTSDSFNKLTVRVQNMHASALGTYEMDDDENMVVVEGKSIADIDISTQEGAAEAIDIVKNAVNMVSDVRGTLGALQNRLDHTINNIGVMTENIQNAESAIRDTDVAEEMMTYTKNNILNQSAQAMLAQANQLPQGVLQLLG